MGDHPENHTRTRLTLQPRHQLIDLNKEYVNCEINFECKAADATKDFEVLVVNQDQLDTVDLSTLEMKRTRGGFVSGNIVADENRRQNYFLVIKGVTEDPIDVDLDIRVVPIAPDPAKLATESPSTTTSVAPTVAPVTTRHWYSFLTEKPMYTAVIVVLLVVIVVVAVMMYRRRASSCGAKDDDAASVVSSSSSKSSSSSESSKSSIQDVEDVRRILHKQQKQQQK